MTQAERDDRPDARVERGKLAEKKDRQFKKDFAMAMWDSLPDNAKERLREAYNDDK